MKKLALAAAMACAFAGIASAADMSAAPFSWTGLYIGLNAGYGYGDSDADYALNFDPVEVGGAADIVAKGALGGGQVGVNWQTGSLVIGLEADLQAADVKGETHIVYVDSSVVDFHGGWNLNWYTTGRLRAGVLVSPRLLLYATGGVAYGEVDSNFDLNVLSGLVEVGYGKTKDQLGWTAGFGFEYAFSDHVTAKVEYQYVDLGSRNITENPYFSDEYGSLTTDIAFHSVKAGLNFLW